MVNIDIMAKNNNKNNARPAQKRIKDRGVAAPSIPKAGYTKHRRRLEDGGKITK